MKETIADLEKNFQAEMEQKQAQVDATLHQLREVTFTLGKEKEKMNLLRQKSRQHADFRQHIHNLTLAIKEEDTRFREKFSTINGEAENNPLSIDSKILPSTNSIAALAEPQKDYLKSLPSSRVLKARLKAYKLYEEVMKDKAAKLHDRSADLEQSFRRVVALCTGVAEERVDSLLEGLVQAVESDPGEVDTARVTSFLRKVDESIGPD